MREKIKNYLKERYSDIGIKKEIIMINSAIVSAAVLLTFLFCFFLNLEKSTQNIEKIARQLTEEQYHTVNSNIPHLEGQIFALMQNKRLQQLLAEAGTEPLDVFSRDGIRTELEQMCHFYHFIDFVVVKDLQGIWYGSGGSSGLDFIRQWDSENGERLKAQTGKCIWEIEDGEIIEDWLTARRKQRVHIRVPKKGTKEKLVELAKENAWMVLSKDRERIKREEGRTIGAVKEIEDWLGLKDIVRMEAYDISNISGFESVGSMVVYEKGKPKRSDYRKFKIKWVQGPNDYASMEEVLTRRFTHESKGEYDSFSILPDLILMDGGRGQVNIARKVLGELGIDIPVCGMVKDDNHRTRGVYFNNVEIPIDTSGEGFHLVTRIQDEAHRFAIEYHRSLRSKEQVHSVLDDIPGIGETRRKALMRRFRSVENIRDASVEELSQTESMNVQSAEAVYQFFHRAPNHTNA